MTCIVISGSDRICLKDMTYMRMYLAEGSLVHQDNSLEASHSLDVDSLWEAHAYKHRQCVSASAVRMAVIHRSPIPGINLQQTVKKGSWTPGSLVHVCLG